MSMAEAVLEAKGNPGSHLISFLDCLQKSNLLTPIRMRQVRRAAEQNRCSPEQLVEHLVQEQSLTRWQAEHLLAGRYAFHLGKYRLLERLGTGGMGSVYRAEKIPFGRIVALKVLRPSLLSKRRAVERFRREIHATSMLNHPNIVTAFDADAVGDTHFLIMEYVPGQTLEYWVRRLGRIPVQAACECVRQAALGLQHAFEQGIVHRDIKPGNLLVTRNNNEQRLVVKILDMGLARLQSQDGNTPLTGSHTIVGTAEFMAPEQARRARDADIRADIYSLGMTLYNLITGRLPFDGDGVLEQLSAKLSEEPLPLRQLCPQVPVELQTVVDRMIVRKPELRFQTPIEVYQALTPFAVTELTANTLVPTAFNEAFFTDIPRPTPLPNAEELFEQASRPPRKSVEQELIETAEWSQAFSISPEMMDEMPAESSLLSGEVLLPNSQARTAESDVVGSVVVEAVPEPNRTAAPAPELLPPAAIVESTATPLPAFLAHLAEPSAEKKEESSRTRIASFLRHLANENHHLPPTSAGVAARPYPAKTSATEQFIVIAGLLLVLCTLAALACWLLS